MEPKNEPEFWSKIIRFLQYKSNNENNKFSLEKISVAFSYFDFFADLGSETKVPQVRVNPVCNNIFKGQIWIEHRVKYLPYRIL